MLGWWWLLLATVVMVVMATDDEHRPVEIHFIQEDYTVNERDKVLEVGVRVRGEVDRDTSFTILVTSRNDTATAGVDFEPVNKSITVASEADYPIQVHILDDDVAKGSRRFSLTLALTRKSIPTITIRRCTVTILEDDKVCVQFNSTSYSIHRNTPLTLSVEKIGTLDDTVSAVNVQVSIDLSPSPLNQYLTFYEGPKEPSTKTVTFSDTSHVGNFTAHLSVRPSSFAKFCNNATVEVMDDGCASVDCAPNAECIGGSCVCNGGYTGDGTICTDIDECEDNPCDKNAVCSNTLGSFECDCKPGYSGDGTTCEEDECGAKCDYTNGVCGDGGNCVCNDGFTLTEDGKTCEGIYNLEEELEEDYVWVTPTNPYWGGSTHASPIPTWSGNWDSNSEHRGSHTVTGFLVTFTVILVVAVLGYILYHKREKIKTFVPRSVVGGGGKGWRYHILPQSMHNTD